MPVLYILKTGIYVNPFFEIKRLDQELFCSVFYIEYGVRIINRASFKENDLYD